MKCLLKNSTKAIPQIGKRYWTKEPTERSCSIRSFTVFHFLWPLRLLDVATLALLHFLDYSKRSEDSAKVISQQKCLFAAGLNHICLKKCLVYKRYQKNKKINKIKQLQSTKFFTDCFLTFKLLFFQLFDLLQSLGEAVNNKLHRVLEIIHLQAVS